MNIKDEIKELQEAFQSLFERVTPEKHAEIAQKVLKARAKAAGDSAEKNRAETTPDKANYEFIIKKNKSYTDDYAKKCNRYQHALRVANGNTNTTQGKDENLLFRKKKKDPFGTPDSEEQLAYQHVYTTESVKEQILTLQEAFQSLFEVAKDGEDKKDKKITVNKIKFEREKQGNEPKEVVSVADELFPYEGSAKEQFNQKVIAKINDMIEGTATLEDLINLVRQKKAPVKESLNSIEEAIELMEHINTAISKKYATQRDAQGVPSPEEQELHQAARSLSGAAADQIDDKNRKEGRVTWTARSRQNGEDTKNEIGMEKTQSRQRYPEGKNSEQAIKASIARHNKKVSNKALEEALLILSEGRKEGESTEDFKNRLHKELVLAIDKKADDAKQNAISIYKKKGPGEEAQAATEKYKKEHNKLEKLDDIQPVANAYARAEQDKPEDTTKGEMQNLKSERRNAEKKAKNHGYNAKQLEKKSIKAEEAGRERKAEALYDKANAEWDKETAEQERAAKAHHKVKELRYGKDN